MFAIVEIAGFQEKVEKGQKLQVPHLAGDPGTSMTFDKVYLISEGDNVNVGTPHVSGASVEVKIVAHGRGEKIRVVKQRRRKRYRRVKGHRQEFTEIEVVSIKA